MDGALWRRRGRREQWIGGKFCGHFVVHCNVVELLV
uniref:Uncharacterized protein n=1 Tax=Arundo donax TaxID=35708 RepID=A0A0A9FGG5_ARUDO